MKTVNGEHWNKTSENYSIDQFERKGKEVGENWVGNQVQ